MITQQTVLMATPIALLATEKGIDLHEHVSDVIKGLNECTSNIRGFTEDNIAVDLPDYTKDVGEHTEVMEDVTTIIADRIRQALGIISKTVKPILKKVETQLRSEIDPGNVSEQVFNYVNVEMVNIEPSFLNSPFYPSEIPANFAGVPSVKLDQLLMGSYPDMSAQDLVELIAVKVDDLATFFANPEEVKRVYDTFFVEKQWFELFSGSSVSNGSVNLNDYSNYPFKSFRSLVIGSLILNRLVANDDPIDGVTGVSLEDYRTSLRLTRDLFSTMLVKFKNIWEDRAAAGVVIISDGVKLENAHWGNLNGVNVLSGKLLIGYNNAVLDMFADREEMSLSEFAVGYVFAKLRGNQVRDIITDRETVIAGWLEYTSDLRAALITRKSEIARRVFVQVLEGLHADEAYSTFIDTIDEAITPSQRILGRVQQQMELSAFFANTKLIDAVVEGENSLMNTVLAAVLADVFESPIAKEILVVNATAPAGTIEQQRKHLSAAIDSVILNRLITL